MNDASLTARAQQGELKAIVVFLNRHLRPHGLNVNATFRGQCLHVLVEAPVEPDQSTSVGLVYDHVHLLGSEVIHSAVIYGRRVGRKKPAWMETVYLWGEPGDDEDEVPASLIGSPAPTSLSTLESVGSAGSAIASAPQAVLPPATATPTPAPATAPISPDRPKIPVLRLLKKQQLLAAWQRPLLGIAAVTLLAAGGTRYWFSAQQVQPGSTVQTVSLVTAARATGASEEMFQQGVAAAMKAAGLTQSARTGAEWQTVTEHWGRAIAAMQAVPSESAKAAIAQKKALEYQKNREYARQRALATSP